MKLLLAAATEAEIAPLLRQLENGWNPLADGCFSKVDTEVHICLTGVGMMSTAYHLIRKINTNSFQFALMAGVAGSFTESIAPGDLVSVETELYGDLGAEDHYNFLDIFELGLLGKDEAPFRNGSLPAPAHPFTGKLPERKVKSLSVNKVSGSDFTVRARKERFGCDIENMEGVAFHYTCLKENIPFAHVRAISNYVTPRDRDSWKMKEAIINLNEWLINFIETL